MGTAEQRSPVLRICCNFIIVGDFINIKKQAAETACFFCVLLVKIFKIFSDKLASLLYTIN